MNRVEFMTELTALLQDISAEERDEALQYYNDYFEDAGSERESEVIKELGNPKRVADMIRAGLEGQDEESCEYRETGYKDTRFESYEHPAARNTRNHTSENVYHYAENHTTETEKKPWTSKWLKIALIILIVCLGLPVVLPLAGGIIMAVLGVIVAIVAAAGGFLIAGIAVAGSGIIVLIAGIAKMFVSVAAGFAYAGIGFLLIAVGAVMTALTWWIAWKLLPPLFRGIVSVFSRMFSKNGKEAQV